MTVLDKQVEYRPLIMVIPRRRHDPERPLADGFFYSDWKEEFAQEWIDLQCETGLFSTKEEAQAQMDAFMKEKDVFLQQFLFVCNAQGKLVGSAGLWIGKHFGVDRLRVHFVSVGQEAQHKGIGSSMVSRLMDVYDAIPSKYPLYLATQTNSYGAIAMYTRLGFTPYFGAWEKCTAEQSEENWEIATQILREKTKTS